tara:strand:- start:261 stop:608 length:348 start_codon:yes stop_codon:yes gene_type:complete
MKSQIIHVNRLRFQSLWKVNCLGFLCGFTPIAILLGAIAALTGANLISINDQYVTGIAALPASLLLSLIFSFVIGTFYAIVQWLGFAIYSRFSDLKLRYYEPKDGTGLESREENQ